MEKRVFLIIIISELKLLAMCELCDWLKSAKRKLEARNSLLHQAKVKKKKQKKNKAKKCGRKKQGDIIIVIVSKQHDKNDRPQISLGIL